MPLASQSTSNNLSKSDRANIGEVHNLSFKTAKLVSASSPQWNLPFFKHSVCGYTIEIPDKPPVESYQTVETSNLSYYLQGWQILNDFYLLFIDLDPISTDNVAQK